MTKAITTMRRAELVAPQQLSVRRSRLPLGALAKYATVALVLAAYLGPLLFLLNTALKSNEEFFSNPLAIVAAPQFGNFVQAWNEGNFGAYLLNSVIYAIAASSIGTAISVLVGFPASRGYLRFNRLWNALFVVLLFLPNAIITQFQLLLRLNLYDTQLGYIMIMAAAVGIGPLLIRGYCSALPRELDEAAAVDGIGYGRYLLTFVLPLARPAIVTVFILQAIGVWNDIILATILLSDPDKLPVTRGLFAFQGTYSSQWSLLAAATLIVAAPLIAAYVFLQRYLVGGVLGGAVKG